VGGATAHLVSPTYPPELEAVRDARRFVISSLEVIGLDACASDAGLMVSELAANAVLHARSSFLIHLRPTLEYGVRVEVEDSSILPPVPTTPSANATSGRGLDLVASMATRWGSHPITASPSASAAGREPVGKVVWFEVEAAGTVVEPEANTEELLALWTDLEGLAVLPPQAQAAAAPAADAGTGSARAVGIITSSMPALEPVFDVVVPDLPAAELLEAKEAMDDLLRELQLLLLSTPAAGTRIPRPPGTSATDEERRVAARLDSAARAFETGRRQVREQVSAAVAAGQELVTLYLRLPASAREAALRFLDAADSADALSRADHLLTLPDMAPSHPLVRRRYLEAVIEQLSEPQA
jgi:hypothetical protein